MSHDFAERGSRILEAFSSQLEQSRVSSSAMLIALDFWLGPRREIIIAGDTDAKETQQMLKLVRSQFLPNAVVLLHDHSRDVSTIETIVPCIKHHVPVNGKSTAYVCENYACQRPVSDLKEFESLLVPRCRRICE